MIEVKKIEALITPDAKLALHYVVDEFDFLERSLLFDMLFKQYCTITTKKPAITISGTLDALLRVTNILHTITQPPYINAAEKAALDTELSKLNAGIEAAKNQKKPSGKTPAFFSLSAQWSGKTGDTKTKIKTKSSSAERRRSSSLSVELRRSSAPGPADMDIIVHPHNTSPATPVKKK